MQSAGVSQISAVIPRIDDLVRVIDNFKDDTTKHPAVRSAAVRGLTILNKYCMNTTLGSVTRHIKPRTEPKYLGHTSHRNDVWALKKFKKFKKIV